MIKINGLLYKTGRHGMIFRFSDSLNEWVKATMSVKEYTAEKQAQENSRRKRNDVSNG